MKTTVFDIVKPEDLESAWGNANFGEMSRRDVVRYALLKYATGYSTGHTIKCILQEVGLINQNLTLSKRGKEYLYLAFYDGNSI